MNLILIRKLDWNAVANTLICTKTHRMTTQNSLDIFSNLFLWWAFKTTMCETPTLSEKAVRSELSSFAKLQVSLPRKCLTGHEALVLNIHLDVWAELWTYLVKHFSVPSNCTVMFYSIKRFALFSLCYICVFV